MNNTTFLTSFFKKLRFLSLVKLGKLTGFGISSLNSIDFLAVSFGKHVPIAHSKHDSGVFRGVQRYEDFYYLNLCIAIDSLHSFCSMYYLFIKRIILCI